MTGRIIYNLVFGLCLCGFGSSAFAQNAEPAPHPDRPRFEALDQDGDGRVSFEEFAAPARRKFAQIDHDGDQRLSTEERELYRQRREEDRRARQFDRADSNGDGKLSREEVRAYKRARADMLKARILDKVDIDGDGRVSDAEKARAKRELRLRKPRRKGAPRPVDDDGDGFISLAEHERFLQVQFDQKDINSDGYISQPEALSGRRRPPRGERK